MRTTTHLLQRLGIALVAIMFVAGIAATTAQARPHSLSGNARFQVGHGLPVPITFQPAPNGALEVPGGVTVQQTVGADPKKMLFAAGAFSNPNGPKNQVFPLTPQVFQVYTNLTIVGGALTLSAGGRTGLPVQLFCPGVTATGGGLGCVGGPNRAGAPVKGLLRYTATGAQFGGANGPGGGIGGSANLAIRVGIASPPGPVTAIFAFATPAPTRATGAAFGFNNVNPLAAPGAASGVGLFTAGFAGTLTNVIASGLGAGLPNTATSWGGPWTTGMLTISQPGTVPPEVFVLSGSDARISGIGRISLVAGALSTRTLSGSSANRGWLNFTVGPDPNVPALPLSGLVTAFGLLTVAGGYALRRARSH